MNLDTELVRQFLLAHQETIVTWLVAGLVMMLLARFELRRAQRRAAVAMSESVATTVAACVPDSPALFLSAGDSAPGAFDSAEDFAEHDVLARAGRLAGIPVRVSCGKGDPFLPGVRQLLAEVPGAESDLGAGGHDVAWWRRAAPGQLAFAGRHLA